MVFTRKSMDIPWRFVSLPEGNSFHQKTQENISNQVLQVVTLFVPILVTLSGLKRCPFWESIRVTAWRSWCKSSWLTIFATTNGRFCSFFSFTGSYFGKPKNRYTARWFNAWPFFFQRSLESPRKTLEFGALFSASQKGHKLAELPGSHFEIKFVGF